MRSLADLHDARSAKTSTPPAASISSDTGNHRVVPLLKIHPGPHTQLRRAFTRNAHSRRQLTRQSIGAVSGADQCSEGADHLENLRDSALIERAHLDVGADERCCDYRLEDREKSGRDRV
jgi:hypothetical protein